jgi:hypothetical protein
MGRVGGSKLKVKRALFFEDESDSGNQINFPLGLVYLPGAQRKLWNNDNNNPLLLSRCKKKVSAVRPR